MKQYLIKPGNWYKANLHCHTTISDGYYSPEEIKKIYSAKGYSIVAFTDHEYIVTHNDLSDDKFLAINGYEVSVSQPVTPERPGQYCKTYHMNFYCKDKNNDTHVGVTESYTKRWIKDKEISELNYILPRETREYTAECVNSFIKDANENGFFVSINHPMWSLQTFTDYKEIEGLWGIELYNHGCNVAGYLEDSNHIYDKLLRQDKYLFPIASDDNHNGNSDCHTKDSFGGFCMINAEKLEYEVVIDALLKGNFYSSTGPVFEEIYIEDNMAHIKCSPVREIRMLTEGRDGMIARNKDGINAATSSKSTALSFKSDENKGEFLTEAVFEIDKGFCGRFIRFDLRGLDGTFADTRAFTLRELGIN